MLHAKKDPLTPEGGIRVLEPQRRKDRKGRVLYIDELKFKKFPMIVI
jgi:hypothetical protein